MNSLGALTAFDFVAMAYILSMTKRKLYRNVLQQALRLPKEQFFNTILNGSRRPKCRRRSGEFRGLGFRPL
jgi:hypothetical protein